MKKKYIFIILFLILGAFFELGKNYSSNSSVINWTNDIVSFNFKKSQPKFDGEDNRFEKIVKNRTSNRSRFKRRATKSRFRSAKPSQTGEASVAKKNDLSKEAKAKKAKAAKEAKNKKDKKKDKKAKVEKGEKSNVTKGENNKDNNENIEDQAGEGKDNTEEELVENAAAAPANPEEEELVDLKEWREKLLRFANHTAMQEFMSEYQSGNINADSFYTIVYEMLSSGNKEISRLAINSAAVLAEYDSFMLLISVLEENTLESDLVSLAESSLNKFSNFRYLNLLKIIVSSENNSPFALSYTAKIIELSAKKAAEGLKAQSENNPQNEEESENSNVDVLESMENFLAVSNTLNTLINTINSGEVINQFQQTVAVIERLDQQFNSTRTPANG